MIIGEPKYKYGQQGQVTVRNHNRTTALERSVLKYLGEGYGYPTSPSASVMAQNIKVFGPHEGFLTHQWIITGNKSQINTMMKQMRTRQKRVATDTWRSLGCRTTH